jgi:DNA primase
LGYVIDTRSFRFLFLPPEHDPDSFVREQGAAAFEAAIEAAVPLSRQLIDQAAVECDLATAEGRSRMLAQARPWIEQLPVGLLREQLLVELAAAGGLGADTLRQHWAAGTAARGPSSGAGRADTRPGGRAQGPDPRRAPAWPGDGDMAGAGGNDPPPPDWPEEASRQGERPPWGASPGGNGGRRGEWSRAGQARGGWSRSERGRGDWPRRESASVGSPRRAPLRAATPLDRAAQILLDQAELWLEHSAEAHGLLCEAPAPYGGFFATVERVLHDQGPLPAHSLKDEVRKVAQADGSADALLPLLDRLEQLHALEVDGESRSGQLRHILRGLQLEAIKDEIKLLLESGELSDEAQKRRNELMQRRDRLKAGAPD